MRRRSSKRSASAGADTHRTASRSAPAEQKSAQRRLATWLRERTTNALQRPVSAIAASFNKLKASVVRLFERYPRAANWRNRIASHFRSVFWQDRPHWYRVALLVLLGLQLSHWITTSRAFEEPRYAVYHAIARLGPRKPYFEKTVVVLIGDDEYWQGELSRRMPIRRDYLACLLRKINEADPSVIALDFDLRSPDPEGRIRGATSDGSATLSVHPQYADETYELLRAVREVGQERPVILPQAIGFPDEAELPDGEYYTVYDDETGEQYYVCLESDVYSGFDFGSADVRFGYIYFTEDIRCIPPRVPGVGDLGLDSFSLAIARASNSAALQGRSWESSNYGTYLTGAESEEHVIPASDVLTLSKHTIKKLRHKTVIVGGAWHTRAHSRGSLVDSYLTPVGSLPGALIHANYVEAILDRRVLSVPSWQFSMAMEISLVVLLAWTLKAWLEGRKRWIRVMLLGLIALLVLAAYFGVHNLGVYFDVPIIGGLLVLHFVAERFVKVIRENRRLREQVRQ